MKLEQFLQALEQDGVWCVANPFVLFKQEEEGLSGECLVQKYILADEKIVVVTLRQLDHGNCQMVGIEVFPRRGVEFNELAGKIQIKRDYINYETLLDGEKYYEYAGVFLRKDGDVTIRKRRYRLNKDFMPDMIKSGFITELEFLHFSKDENVEKLPIVDLIDLHRYLPKKECEPDICSWCQCDKDEHDKYWPCPLLGGRLLCNLCCHYDSRSDDPFLILNVPEMLEVARFLNNPDLTLQEAVQICRDCGNGGLGYWARGREDE